MKKILLFAATLMFTAHLSLANERPPAEWNAWARWAAAQHPVGDEQGHGPDTGSDEWAAALARQLGIADDDAPDFKSAEWRAAVEKKLTGANDKLTFVMVHGATAGGWEWKSTAACLTDDGHTVYRATLTGLGERFHLANRDVNLDTHINDVVNLILFEDLHEIVLTGHSYGGMVITGVMNRVPDRIRHVIYLDAAVPDNGQSMYDLVGGPPPQAKVVNGLVEFGPVDTSDRYPKNVPQAEKTFSQPVSYDNPATLRLPVTFVAFVPDGQSIEERAKKDKGWQKAVARGWTTRTFTGHHVAQQENPRGLATLLEQAASDTNRPANENK